MSGAPISGITLVSCSGDSLLGVIYKGSHYSLSLRVVVIDHLSFLY